MVVPGLKIYQNKKYLKGLAIDFFIVTRIRYTQTKLKIRMKRKRNLDHVMKSSFVSSSSSSSAQWKRSHKINIFKERKNEKRCKPKSN